MKLKQNRSGFTLLEIIIVIIIVGVLASLALPRFFATVEYSKSTEALNAIGVIRQSMERCFVASNQDYTTCFLGDGINPDSLDVDNPGTTPGARFAYVVNGQAATGYVITATRNVADGGDGTSTITLTVNNTLTPPVSRAGTGKFAGIR